MSFSSIFKVFSLRVAPRNHKGTRKPKWNILDSILIILGKLKGLMFSQKYLYTVLATLSLSFGLRSGILFFFGIDVIKTPFELISVGYYFILAILIPLLHIIIKNGYLRKDLTYLF
jgi:hypothetical protein